MPKFEVFPPGSGVVLVTTSRNPPIWDEPPPPPLGRPGYAFEYVTRSGEELWHVLVARFGEIV